MLIFTDRFRANTTLEAVAAFHSSTLALKRLSPPPIIVQFNKVDPLAEGSLSDFTLWFGPLPLRWLAVHSQVDPDSGFIDTQVRGPMAAWRHQHSWRALPGGGVELSERVEYEHQAGWNGLLTRILFAPPMLAFLFAYRRWAIRRGCEK
jgi:ligand-binding SRPBCC domain-containing protein